MDRGSPQDRLDKAAEGAKYEPSPYHCPDGSRRPRFRAKPASICSYSWNPKQALRALQDAIRARQVSTHWIESHPRFVWQRAGEVWYEATTKRGTAGVYHAYEVEEAAVPIGLRS